MSKEVSNGIIEIVDKTNSNNVLSFAGSPGPRGKNGGQTECYKDTAIGSGRGAHSFYFMLTLRAKVESSRGVQRRS